jgi:hypothetical protein
MNENSALKQFLDTLMAEIKPFLSIDHYDDRLAKIHTVFTNKSLTPAKYHGIMQKNTFAVWIMDDTVQEIFQCTKLWIELVDERANLLDKIYDLRDILSHEWLILVIDSEATYTMYRPLIWAKVQGLKKIVAQM